MSETVQVGCKHQPHMLYYYVSDDILECPVCLRLEYYRHESKDGKACVHFECGWSMMVDGNLSIQEQQKQLYRNEKLDRTETPKCLFHNPKSHPKTGFNKTCSHGLLHVPHYCTCCGNEGKPI